MKKIAMLAMALALMLSMSACGCSNRTNTPTVQPTEAPTRPTVPPPEPTIVEPTFETNIPDPDVDNDHMIDEDATSDMTEDVLPGGENDKDGTGPLGRIRRYMK